MLLQYNACSVKFTHFKYVDVSKGTDSKIILGEWIKVFGVCRSWEASLLSVILAPLHGKNHICLERQLSLQLSLMSYSLGHQEQEVKDVLEGSKFLGLWVLYGWPQGLFLCSIFFLFRRRGQRQGRCVLHGAPWSMDVVGGLPWTWDKYCLSFLIAYFCCFLNCGLTRFYSFSTLKVCLSSSYIILSEMSIVFFLIAMSFFSLVVSSVNVSRFVDFCFCFVFRYFSWIGVFWAWIYHLRSSVILENNSAFTFQICFFIHYLSHGISIIYKLDYLISTSTVLHAVFCLGWSYVFYSCFIEILAYNVV